MNKYWKWLWFPVAVVATSVVLVAALAAIAIRPAGTALASSLGAAHSAGNAPWAHGAGFNLPPELQGLATIPTDQRFSHFVGAQVNLKDKDGRPLTISVTPGKVTTASATSLSIAANDGTSRTFALDSSTAIHRGPKSQSTPTTSTELQNGDDIVVVTLNNSNVATAVIDGGATFAGPSASASGAHGPWGPLGSAH